MSRFPIHTLQDAPEGSRATLRTLEETFGFVPNVAGAIAGSPPLVKAFLSVFQNAHSSSLDEAQIQVLLLTNAITNGCSWAVAFHTHLALLQGVAADDVDAIRSGRTPKHAQHAALSTVARRLIELRGHIDDADLDAFSSAGFRKEQVLDVILVSSASTITNYVATVAHPPLENAFQAHVWNRSLA